MIIFHSDFMSLLTVCISKNASPEEMRLLPTIQKIRSQFKEVERIYHIPGNLNPSDVLMKALNRCAATLKVLLEILRSGYINGTDLQLTPTEFYK